MVSVAPKLLIDIAVSTAMKVASAFAALVFSIGVSRLMSLEDASNFFFLHSAVTVLAVVVVMGMDLLVLRGTSALFRSPNEHWITDLRRSSMSFSGIAAAVVLSLTYIILLLWGDATLGGAWPAGMLFPIAVPFMAYIILNSEFLRGLGYFNAQILFQGIAVPLGSMFLLAVWWMMCENVSLVAGAVAFTLTTILVATVSAARWAVARTQLDQAGRGGRFRPELLSGFADFFFLSGAQTILQFSPVIIVGLYNAGTDLGLYYAAFRIAMLVSFVLTASNVVISPLLSRAHSRADSQAMVDLVRLSSALGGLSSAPIALLLFLRGDYFLWFFGSAYVEALPILRILLIGQVINAFSGAVLFFLVMSNRQKIVVKINMAGLAVSLIGGYMMIGAYGSMGAAITATFVMSLINLSAVVAVYTTSKFVVIPWISRECLSGHS